MNRLKNILFFVSIVGLSLSVFVAPSFAAAPDGLSPWADSVVSFHQGLMKNGLALPIVRSDPTAALGVAENTPTINSTFFSLGFGGNIVLGLDNGISSGVLIVESTIEPGYPDETARVDMSQDGVNWVMAGNVTQDGTVTKPIQLTCAKFIRITDTSVPADYSDDTADGYDVDGVRTTGTACPEEPTVTPTPTVVPNQTPTQPQPKTSSNTSSGGSSGGSPSSSSNSSSSCTSSGVTTVPSIISARRLSSTSIVVSWGPNAGLTNFIVEYGFQNGNWQFSTKVSGFSTTINDLPANQFIWIHVAATDNCAIGAYGRAVLVGGTAATNSPGFPNTGTRCPNPKNPLIPCFPNTGSTGLPNTGFDPQSNIFWNIQMSIQYIISLLKSITS
jgi:hypothetical protein